MKRITVMLFCIPLSFLFSRETLTFEGSIINAIGDLEKGGYEILYRTSGNINGDAQEDYALVLAEPANQNRENGRLHRIALLALSNADKGYTITQNDNAVYFYGYDENFPESFVDATVRDGKITIGHYGGFAVRWARSTSFVYDRSRKAVYFDKDHLQYLDASDFNSVISERTITSENGGCGTILFSSFDINSGIFIK